MGVEESDPTKIFDSLTNSTRVDILEALASAYGDSPTEPWVEYSDLQKMVGVRDNGNFNYHLRQLDGFLEKEPAGYTLTRSGIELLSAVQAGLFDADWTWGPVDAPGDCLFCERSVELHYEDGVLWLTCGDDEHSMGLWASPALLVSQPEDDIVEKVAFLGNQWGAMTRRGICSDCQGQVEGQLEYGGAQPDHYHYHARCQHCRAQHAIPLGLYLSSHPTVWDFYDDHGVDVRTTPFWTLDFATPGNETVLSEDPLRLRVDLTQDGERLSLDVAEDGSVVSTDPS
jgi:hypothetical protein